MSIVNKKALFDYQVLDTYQAGVQLTGAEVKSLRGGRGTLDGAFVKLMGTAAYLIGAQIFPYPFAHPQNFDSKRTRKLLLHKRELLKLKHKVEANGLTVIPISWYTNGRHIKLDIALAKGKKQYEKRDTIKKRTEKRELERVFRGKVK